jgi:hypothetical protein
MYFKNVEEGEGVGTSQTYDLRIKFSLSFVGLMVWGW